MHKFGIYPMKAYRLKEYSLGIASCSIGIRRSTDRKALRGYCFQCQSQRPPFPRLFHLAFRYSDGETASKVSFKRTLEQLYLDWFAEYHVVGQLFIAGTAVAKYR